MDYYHVLGLTPSAADRDIAQAYRRLALQYHPRITTLDRVTAIKHLSQVSEAFDVLSDPERKAFYDKHGEYLLKKGLLTEEGFQGGYHFHGKPDLVFQQFFGCTDPFTQLHDKESTSEASSILSYAYKQSESSYIKNPEALKIKLPCTLQQLFYGCVKKYSYSRQTLQKDGRTLKTITQTKKIDVPRGLAQGDNIIFSQQGHESPGAKQSDLIFEIEQTEHPVFSREADKLVIVKDVSLKDALLSTPIHLSSIDKKELTVTFNEVVIPASVMHIPGEGMPVKGSERRGGLEVRVNIIFPESLSFQKKEQLTRLVS